MKTLLISGDFVFQKINNSSSNNNNNKTKQILLNFFNKNGVSPAFFHWFPTSVSCLWACESIRKARMPSQASQGRLLMTPKMWQIFGIDSLSPNNSHVYLINSLLASMNIYYQSHHWATRMIETRKLISLSFNSGRERRISLTRSIGRSVDQSFPANYFRQFRRPDQY